jgi:hypothetical protein
MRGPCSYSMPFPRQVVLSVMFVFECGRYSLILYLVEVVSGRGHVRMHTDRSIGYMA